MAAAGGAELTWEQHDGLADIRLDSRLPAGQTTTLRMQIHGRPDIFFAYLDSAFNPLDISIQEGNIFILGFKSAIFTRPYTVLLPGVRWLPASGADVGRGDPHGRPVDFFDVDLTVEVPQGMLVAGPGKRRPAEGAAAGGEPFGGSFPDREALMWEIASLDEEFETKAPPSDTEREAYRRRRSELLRRIRALR